MPVTVIVLFNNTVLTKGREFHRSSLYIPTVLSHHVATLEAVVNSLRFPSHTNNMVTQDSDVNSKTKLLIFHFLFGKICLRSIDACISQFLLDS